MPTAFQRAKKRPKCQDLPSEAKPNVYFNCFLTGSMQQAAVQVRF